ncbi:hypothetical protein BDW60DRAFT_181630 [Aspergillus nidulans var. acristatus]
MNALRIDSRLSTVSKPSFLRPLHQTLTPILILQSPVLSLCLICSVGACRQPSRPYHWLSAPSTKYQGSPISNPCVSAATEALTSRTPAAILSLG